MDNQRLLVPYPEARAILGGISRSKFYELISAGELAKVAIGTRVFVTIESLHALVQRHTVDTGAA